MAKRGRPVMGAGLVEGLKGGTGAESSPAAKERLAAIIRTLTGERTVDQACTELGIGRSAFHKLRSRFLAQAAGLLEPRKSGRKRRVVSEEELEVQRLKEENARLRFELKAQQVREEIAVLMPHLLRERSGVAPGGRGKKTTLRRTPDSPRTGGGSGGTSR